MEAAKSLIASPPPFPPRTHPRSCASSISPATAVTSMPTASLARNFPTSALLQEQRDEYRPLLQIFKEDKTSQVTLDRRHMTTGTSSKEEDPDNSEQLVHGFQLQLSDWPGLNPLLPPPQKHENQSLSSNMQSYTMDTKLMDVELSIALASAKKALLASKQAVMLNEGSAAFEDDVNSLLSHSLGFTSSTKLLLDKGVTVRSRRLEERRSKKRRVPKAVVHEGDTSRTEKAKRKRKEAFSIKDPFQSLLSRNKTKLLTAEEELKLFAQIENSRKIEEVRSRLESHFGREPTMVEWSKEVGVSSQTLRSQINSGYSSKEKLISANIGLVVYIAKPYLSSSVTLEELFMAGYMGLLKSVERFKPQAGCRFSTYAYWWIRQAVRMAMLEITTINRLPSHIHALVGKIWKAKRLYGEEGNYNPSNEELAKRVNIPVDKLQKVLLYTRKPISMERNVWGDDGVTFHDITEDPRTESPEKELMRLHLKNLVIRTLNPRERKIIWLRFGIQGGRPHTLSEIGKMFGITQERVRILEMASMEKIKQSVHSEGLDAYKHMFF
uniref:Sigma factor n=1 Tax=Monsonia emarginata TaxID=28966 RepID=A0A0G2STR7_9ROSI|nr:sigma factor [Monsonia emarginata]